MSDLSTLGMTGALFLSCGFLIYYFTARINDRGHEILTGVVAGVPISAEYRRFLLWVTWLTQWAGVVMISIISTALFVAIARQAGGEDARTIAYLCAVGTGLAAFQYLVLGFPYIRLLASAVSQTKRV